MELVERRQTGRYRVDLSGQLLIADKLEISARITDISLSGLQLEVLSEFTGKLFPNIDREHSIDTVQFNLLIYLPRSQPKLALRVGAVYLRRVGAAKVVIGCRFEQFYDDAEQYLAEYLQQILSANS